MKIGILGYGACGKSISSLLKENKVPHIIWTHSVDKCKDNPNITCDLQRFCKEIDTVYIAIGSNYIKETINKILRFSSPKVMVNFSKGFVENDITISKWIESIGYYNLVSVQGPSFSKDILNKKPTRVYASGFDTKVCEEILSTLSTSYFKILLQPNGCRDIREYESSMKNVVAILMGLCAYFDLSNLSGTIFQEFITELKLLLGTTITQLDDLFISCSSTNSRNYKFGYCLGQMSIDFALSAINQEIEGYNSIRRLDVTDSTTFPILTLVKDLVANDYTKEEKYAKLCGII